RHRIVMCRHTQSDPRVEVRLDGSSHHRRVRALRSENDVHKHGTTRLCGLLDPLFELLSILPTGEHDLGKLIDEDDKSREEVCLSASTGIDELLLGCTRRATALSRASDNDCASSRDLLVNEPFEDGIYLLVAELHLGELRCEVSAVDHIEVVDL